MCVYVVDFGLVGEVEVFVGYCCEVVVDVDVDEVVYVMCVGEKWIGLGECG